MKNNQPEDDDKKLQQEWDRAAASFDEEPDHGLRPEPVRQAWTKFLQTWLPPAPARVLDVGCGTGSLSVVMAQLGYAVTGIDLSPEMIRRAKDKAAAAGQVIDFQVMNAARLVFPAASFDVLLCRHLLWVFPQPGDVLRRWAGLLKPGGRLILVEGLWSTGAGLHTAEIIAALPETLRLNRVVDLSRKADYWGKPVHDERYALIADLPS